MPETKPGVFMWNELLTNDASAATAFYTKVIGWQTDTMPMPGESDGSVYHLWKAGDDMAGGMMQMSGPQFEGVPPHWQAYVHVADVDATAGKVEAAGGKVIAPPFDIPGVGRIAIIMDPAGAALGIMKPAPQEGAG